MKEKRTGPDTVLNIISVISITLWVIVGTVIVLFAIANPTNAGMAAGRPGLKNPGTWVKDLMYGLLIIQILLSVSGVTFNLMRMKRKTDHVRLTHVLTGIFGIIGVFLLTVK